MSYVYLIGPTDWRFNRVKIGYTKSDPKARLSNLQTGSPFVLDVLAFFKGEPAFEKLLHEAFAPLRENGEWFRLEGKLLAFVSDLYFNGYGSRPISDSELWQALQFICEEEPPRGLCDYYQWHDSVSCGVIEGWMHDIAWAEHVGGAK